MSGHSAQLAWMVSEKSVVSFEDFVHTFHSKLSGVCFELHEAEIFSYYYHFT